MDFYTAYTVRNRQRKYEKVDNHSETERAGYIPAKNRIENLILAGQRLKVARAELYDFGPDDEVDESFSDPTRSANYDMADASQQSLAVEHRLKESKKRRDEESKKVAEEAKVTKKESDDKTE